VLLILVLVPLAMLKWATGGPHPATPYFIVPVLRHCVDVGGSAIRDWVILVAVLGVRMTMSADPMANLTDLSGRRLNGCTCHTLAGETAVSCYWISKPPSADAWAIVARAEICCSGPRRLVLPRPLARCARSPSAAQLEGGLKDLCSRLGRPPTPLGRTLTPQRQFVGTTFRCLGPLSHASPPVVCARKRLLLPGMRISPFLWRTTASASPGGPCSVVIHRLPAPQADWRPFVSVLPRALPLPRPAATIRLRLLGRGAMPSPRRCLLAAATRASTNRRPRMRPRETRNMLCLNGATASLAV
jgi:hypothetical protein